ncbi:MAG: hypothetical protein ABMA13_14190 [Chthoniobacteraceae bacterium]
MARFLRRVLLGVSGALAIFTALLVVGNVAAGAPFHTGALVWATPIAAALLALAAFKLTTRRQFLLVFLLVNTLLLELLLEAAGWLGVLPGITDKDRCAYGRVYWTAEGRGNSIRNRFGWYAPAFDLAAPHRIAVIGDSLVEAVEVHRTRNAATRLGDLLRSRPGGFAVLGLGAHGTAPAHSLEILDYATRHFTPREAIFVLSIGSDIRESSRALNGLPPDAFIYFGLDASGRAVPDPASTTARENFMRSIELPHSNPLVQVPFILRTHCMLLQTARSMRDAVSLRRRLAARPDPGIVGDIERDDFFRNGFDPTPFAIPPSPESQRALAVMLAELRLAKETCDARGVVFRIVTVPHFPTAFYRTQTGAAWTAQVGAYDYLRPERDVAAFAAAESIPCLALGTVMSAEKMSVDDIRAFYLLDGVGHLSERGHEFVAAQIARAFYPTP